MNNTSGGKSLKERILFGVSFAITLPSGKRLLLLFFILTFSFFYCYSQSAQQQIQIDSLHYKISIAAQDIGKLNLYIILLNKYLEVNPAAGLQYQKDALDLAEKLKFQNETAALNKVIGRINWITGNFDQALKYHFDALKIYEKMHDDKQVGIMTTYIGQDYADQGNYSEALKYFNLALKMYEDMDDQYGVANCYMFFAFIYGMIGNTAEAAKANYNAMKIFESLGDKYSVAITISNLADNYVTMDKYDEALVYYNQALEVLEVSNDKVNLSSMYVTIGNLYIKKGNLDKASTYFLTAFKIGKEINNPYCMGIAYEAIAETYILRGELNKTLEYYLAAEQLYQSVSNNQNLASVYNQIGSLYLNLNNLTKAKEYYDKMSVLTETSRSIPILKDYYNGIQLLDSARGEWKNAYLNFKQYIFYRDSLYNEENTKASMQTVLQYEFDKKEAAAKMEQEKKDIAQRNIRNAISAGLAGTLFFLIIVYRQRNKVSKARKRSDELLLNILPSEVANELKEKGSADAKQFDEVTVMFTDFKDFTRISEKLSPKELVTEIHLCFKTFDNIISKYNIEKIKTIGDSYMCAGGLPVANKTNAIDIVSAALEIRGFMLTHAEKRKNENKEPFEIRIGIHTGQVVAGIVGVKKFAYDIWGDTVNIASRMESSGEAGKINISGTTYELVKNNFNCTFRGKISAKNKGEIEMYFVEN